VSIFLGIGTGRCGTNSLAAILNQVKGAAVTHEGQLFRSDKWGDPGSCVENFIKQRPAVGLYGDVAFYHLPVISAFKEKIPGLKLVSLHRSKQEVAESFLRRIGSDARLHDSLEGWNKMFPVIRENTAIASWLKYCDMYEEELSKLDTYCLQTSDLNDNKKLNDLFDFLEVKEKDRVYPKVRVFNAGRRRKNKRYHSR
jgi:hypothetical protein